MGVVVPFRPKVALPTWNAEYAIYDGALFDSLSDEKLERLLEAGRAGLAASEQKLQRTLSEIMFGDPKA